MTGPARSRPGGRSARVRCEVMGAVVELLGEGGVEAVSVAEVARRAGVNPTSIYRRWRTVDVLILEAAHDLSLAAVTVSDTGSLEGDLAAVVRSVAAFLRSDIGGAMARAIVDAPPGVLERLEWAEFWASRFDRLEPVLARATRRGEWQGAASQEEAVAIGRVLAAQTYFRTLFLREELDADAVRGIVRQALAAPERSARGPAPRAVPGEKTELVRNRGMRGV